MSAAGNVVWFITLGWLPVLILYPLSLILYISWIFKPQAAHCMELASLVLAPFGKDIISDEQLNLARSIVQDNPDLIGTSFSKTNQTGVIKEIRYDLNRFLSYLILPINIVLRLILAIYITANGAILFATIVLIPLGLQTFKIAAFVAWPFGGVGYGDRIVVTKEAADEVRRVNAKEFLKK